jgi:hypothetical protein
LILFSFLHFKIEEEWCILYALKDLGTDIHGMPLKVGHFYNIKLSCGRLLFLNDNTGCLSQEVPGYGVIFEDFDIPKNFWYEKNIISKYFFFLQYFQNFQGHGAFSNIEFRWSICKNRIKIFDTTESKLIKKNMI